MIWILVHTTLDRVPTIFALLPSCSIRFTSFSCSFIYVFLYFGAGVFMDFPLFLIHPLSSIFLVVFSIRWMGSKLAAVSVQHGGTVEHGPTWWKMDNSSS